MSDLVNRLRKLAERERPYGSLPDTLDEAADRIAQLEAEVEEQVQWVKDLADLQIKAEARIAQLEAALEEAERKIEAMYEDLAGESI